MRTLAHIVNPVVIGETSDLFMAQPITLESMRLARELARSAVEVSLHTAQFAEDHAIIPDYLACTPTWTAPCWIAAASRYRANCR